VGVHLAVHVVDHMPLVVGEEVMLTRCIQTVLNVAVGCGAEDPPGDGGDKSKNATLFVPASL
jgi:hypothetical protein